MPQPSIWMIRLSLAYLLLSVTIGSLLLVEKATGSIPAIWALLPLHFELAIWGWLVQFVMGTAYWMFPKKLIGPKRGPATAAWVLVAFYQLGLLLLCISLLTDFFPWFSLAGRFSLMISVGIFVLLIWGRIVTYRKYHES